MRRRVAVSLAATLGTVLVASRVNPPHPPPLSFPTTSRIADEVLPDVRRVRSGLPEVVAAINTAAGRERVRLELKTANVAALETGLDHRELGRWRDVRLGTVLAMGAHGAFRSGDVDWREEGGVLVVRPPAPVTCRVFDVSELAAELRAEVEASRRRPARLGGNICFPRVGPPPPVDEEVNWALGVLVSETIEPGAWEGFRPGWWVVAWGGRLFVQSSEMGHRQVEAFLELIRRGEPAGFGAGGGR
jgi:hypothetical protein